MNRYNTQIKFWLVLLLVVNFGCSKEAKEASVASNNLPCYQDATFTPKWLDHGDEQLTNFHQIPSFELVNQEGEPVTEADLDGRIHVADFFFTTCPGICPKMVTNMTHLQEAFEHDEAVMLVSYSVTPEIDDVTQLANYAQTKGIKSGKWHLLTGDRKTIYEKPCNIYINNLT